MIIPKAQPEIYNNPEELTQWLKRDLKRQRKEGIKEDELVLNIGGEKTYEELNFFSIDKQCKKEVKFVFNIENILKKLGCCKMDEENIICPYNINAIGITFSEASNFFNVTFTGRVYIYYSVFKKHTIFFGCNFNKISYFNECDFENISEFSNCTFNIVSYFSECNMRYPFFFYCIFSGNTHFLKCNFIEYTEFKKCTFNGKCSFSEIKIENTIKFENMKLSNDESYTLFEDIDLVSNKNSKIKIINTVINGRIVFNDVAINEIDFKGSDILGSGVLNRINFKAEPENWQTAVFLKNEEIKRSNTIEALKYKGTEKYLYTKYLKDEKEEYLESIKETSDFPLMRYYSERFSLWISKVSNDHGQNWTWAVIFTLISGFLFFSLSVATGVFDYTYYTVTDINKFFMDYLNYLIPTNFNLIKCVNINMNTCNLILFAIFYLLGKISVGYGIFEVIQAFRKFNSKG